MVMLPARCAAPVLASAVKVTSPLPELEAGVRRWIHEAFETAIQESQVCERSSTSTDATPPPAGTEPAAGVKTHSMPGPSCAMGNVKPSRVMLPVRGAPAADTI